MYMLQVEYNNNKNIYILYRKHGAQKKNTTRI